MIVSFFDEFGASRILRASPDPKAPGAGKS
jgi:hypothetical protein